MKDHHKSVLKLWKKKWRNARGEAPKAERLQKFRYGVPPFQKLPVWRSGAFRLSLSTAISQNTTHTIYSHSR